LQTVPSNDSKKVCFLHRGHNITFFAWSILTYNIT